MSMLRDFIRPSVVQTRAILLVFDIAIIAPVFVCAALLSDMTTVQGFPYELLPAICVAGVFLNCASGLPAVRLADFALPAVGLVLAIATGLGLCLHIAQLVYLSKADAAFSAIFTLGMAMGMLAVRIVGYLAAKARAEGHKPQRVLLFANPSRADRVSDAVRKGRGMRVVALVHPATSAVGRGWFSRARFALRDLAAAIDETGATTLLIDQTDLCDVDVEIVRRRACALGLRVEDWAGTAHEADARIDTGSYLNRGETRFLDLPLGTCYAGEVVMVTGAGGTIGAELCRQLLRLRPSKLILLDHSEYLLYELDRRLRDLPEANSVQLVSVLATVLDEAQLLDIMKAQEVAVVFHAAAYKHVPLVEQNRKQALANNVLGTENVVRCCKALSVSRLVLISSDKAVRPRSTMGLSKWIAEQIVHTAGATTPDLATGIVRFGNVLGSSGSVLPLFIEQASRGGPVTVTHPEVERYFMTLDEAVHLVIQAGVLVCHGEVFTLDMGRPVRIADLARQVVGNVCAGEGGGRPRVAIKYTGLRRGEKMREELSYGKTVACDAHSKILVAPDEPHLSEIETAQLLREVRQAVATPGPLAEGVLAKVFSKADARWAVTPTHQSNAGQKYGLARLKSL